MDPQQFQHELNRMNMQQQNQMVNQQMMNQQQQVRCPNGLVPNDGVYSDFLENQIQIPKQVVRLELESEHDFLFQGYGSSVHSDDDSDDDDDQSGQKRSRKSGSFGVSHQRVLYD